MRPSELTAYVENLQKRYPLVTQVLSIGTNEQGDSIPALRMSLTPGSIDTTKVGYFVVGGHHGNEPHSVTLALHFAESIARKFSTIRLRNPTLDSTEWWVVPAVNLPGLEAGHRLEAKRDPNREYPGPCHTASAAPLKSVQAIIDVMASRPFAATATLHGYIGSLTSPWGTTTPSPRPAEYPTYEKWLRAASRRNGYRWGTSAEVIYPANGTFEDFAYWKHGAWSLLVELKTGSALDIAMTTDALFDFFDSVDQSHDVTAQESMGCLASELPDLQLE